MFYDNLCTVMEHYSKAGGFLTVKAGEEVNTMTVSWGFVGFMWNKPQFICVVRPQRHTFGMISRASSFTVSVPFGDMAEELRICGAKSGRDFDKSQAVAFAPAKSVDSPVVHGCAMYFECAINYRDALKGGLLPEAVRNAHYSDDFHHFFIGEIVEAY